MTRRRRADTTHPEDHWPLSEVIVGPTEPFDVALRRFMKKVQMDGILSEAKRRQSYEKPGDKLRRERARTLRKLMKKRIRAEARSASRR
jgi:small subunit ribosomal protein S21